MTDWFLFLGDNALAPTDLHALVVGLLLSMLLGQVSAWVYMFTHSGLSYSRTFVNSLVVTPVVVSLVMVVLTNNVVTAFGLLAVFAIVRFRNILRDTLDTAYLLMNIFTGMACGTQRFSIAVAGCLTVCAIMVYLWYCAFGTRHRCDLVLNLHWAGPATGRAELDSLLARYSRAVQLAGRRTHQGIEGADLSYRLLMRDCDRVDEMLDELRRLPAASQVNTLRVEDESEV
jgi:hypothetical protein